jgi:hypothetical protein
MAADAGLRWSRWSFVIWGVWALILLTPLVAMQFTDEVDWSPLDFVFMGALLGGVGLGVEFVIRKGGSAAYRVGALIALAAAFLLVWMNAAVGIIGSEQEDANILYGGVLAVVLVGTLAARLRPGGMALTMAAAALVQLLVPLAAPIFGAGARAAAWIPQVLMLNGVFAAMWLLSAWLFRRAAARQGSAA